MLHVGILFVHLLHYYLYIADFFIHADFVIDVGVCYIWSVCGEWENAPEGYRWCIYLKHYMAFQAWQ